MPLPPTWTTWVAAKAAPTGRRAAARAEKRILNLGVKEVQRADGKFRIS